jgi:hypothetical protein
MSLTYTIDHAVATVEDVSVEVADKASLALQSTIEDTAGGVVSTYVINAGDPTYPATVVYRSALVLPKGKPPYRRASVTLNSWARVADSVTGLDKLSPIQATISINIPQEFPVELADLNVFLGNLYSFTYPSVSTKLRATTTLSKLMFGISQL